MAALEERLGVRLINRTTRQFIVTEAGKRYYRHCQAILVEADAAQDAIDQIQAEPQGIIRLTCPIGLLKFHVGAMLADFMAKYPKITLHLEATDRRVDVVGEGMDIAIRVRPRPLEDSRLILRVLSDRGQALVAAPTLLRQYPEVCNLKSLASLPSLSSSLEHQPHVWHLHNGQEVVQVQHSPRFTTTDMYALKEAAIKGVGVVQLPLLMLAEDLAVGRLQKVLPEWEPRREVIHLVFPSRRGLLPSVRALIDFLADHYASFDEA